MIPLPWLLVGAFFFAGVAGLAGFKVGGHLKQGEWDAAELTKAQKVIVRERVISQKVPTIVTKYVTEKVTVEKEVERVVTRIPQLLDADCVLPGNYGLLLVAAANGLDPETAVGAHGLTGQYGCREVLASTLADLEAGWRNTAQLHALQQWVEAVTNE